MKGITRSNMIWKRTISNKTTGLMIILASLIILFFITYYVGKYCLKLQSPFGADVVEEYHLEQEVTRAEDSQYENNNGN
ncbi:uncharacterized protein EAF01_001298 [Botrytis porri]|uniref:uncharacterized protein n=1 Tax=Botrytis porri TaxID=87229 RepID=UPI001901CDD3|nr:uncharacterized protein EAF01_001298 [Botrytis porri]KAF7912277.1 hypothetical protein EAF01_001298 [Botrytis porri]